MKKKNKNYSVDDIEKMADALLVGGIAVQATPMLRASGRTPTALTNTATGMVGVGIAGSLAKTAFGMVKSPMKWGLSKKERRRR